jgi:Tfp pilus assembly protein PilF
VNLLSRTLAAAGILLVVVGCDGQPATGDAFPPPGAARSAAPAPTDFAGAGRCAGCHRPEYDAWRRSTHGRAGGPPGPGTLLAPFDGRPIRFGDATVTPHRTAQGRYAFRVARQGRAERVFTVDGVVGGGHMAGGGTQAFLTRHVDGTLRVLPFEVIRDEGVWFCNTNSRLGKGWLPITPALRLADCGDWPPVRVLGDVARFANCQACHGSRIRTTLDPGRRGYRTEVATLAVDCESCHGPAAAHADSPGVALRSLATLDKDGSLEVCFQCHALKDVVAPGYLPGASFVEHYALKFPLLGDRPLHPDGRVRTFAYQETQLYSDCYRNGSMTCVDCHDPHSQGYRDVRGRALRDRLDDGQCLSCHPSKGDSIEAHTRHPRGRPGGRCVDCHMPYLQEPEVGSALRYARSDHTIPIPRPVFDAELGVGSACAACHRERSAADLELQVRAWFGTLKPPAQTDSLHPFARFAETADLLERSLSPNMPGLPKGVEGRLRALARSADPDLQAIALASLHLARGDEPGVRRFLAERLGALGAADRAVRGRWVLALGFIGDRYRTDGDHFRAITAYKKALEVLPDHAGVLANLGLAYQGAGNGASAVVHYERSLAADSLQPLTHVNWGIALAQLGDTAGAEAHYRRALALDAHDALALLNLGNIHLLRNDLVRAAELYRAALESDGSLALAHFYLGQTYAMLQDRRALSAVREGLDLAPDHPVGRDLLRRLSAAP